MRSPELALAWEFWRRGRFWILFLLACHTIFQILILSKMAGDLDRSIVIVFQYLFLWLSLIVFVPILVFVQCEERNGGGRFPVRYYTLPIPTWRLVAVQMILGTSTVLLMYLISALLLIHVLIGRPFPLFGPSLFIVTVLPLMYSVAWGFPELSLSRNLIVLLFFVPAAWWLGQRYGTLPFPHPPLRPTHFWTQVTRSEVLTLSAVIALAYGVTMAGVARDRRGAAHAPWPGWIWLKSKLSKIHIEFSRTSGKQLATPQRAQFWYEWRMKGAFMPIGFGSLLVIALLYGFLSGSGGDTLEMILAVGFVLTLFGAFPFGLLIGHNNPFREKRWGLDSFKATRPLSTTALAFANLKTVIGSYVLTLLLGIVSILVWTAWLALRGRSTEIIQVLKILPDELRDWSRPGLSFSGVLFYLLIMWILMSLGAVITMTGRLRFVKWAFLVIALLLLTPLILSALPPALERMLIHLIVWDFTALSVGGMVWAYVRALRLRLLSQRMMQLALLAWAGLYLFALFNIYQYGSGLNDPIDFLAMLGVCALPVAPFALAPLAMSWNRHR